MPRTEFSDCLVIEAYLSHSEQKVNLTTGLDVWCKNQVLYFSLFLPVHTKEKKTFLPLRSEKLQSDSCFWWNVSAVMTTQKCCLLIRSALEFRAFFFCLCPWTWQEFLPVGKTCRCYRMPLIWGFFLQLLSHLFSFRFKLGESEETSCCLRNHYQVSQ